MSSIHKLVKGLTAVGYLDEEDQHRFALGPAPYVLSLRSRRLPIRDIRHDDLVALSQTAVLPTLLAVRVGLSAMYVDWAGTDEPFDYALAAGMRAPLDRTAAGRVLLAHLHESDRKEAVDLITRDNTDASVALLEQCQTIRSQGYAMQTSDHQMRHTTAIAAPIVQHGTVVAAIALADQQHSLAARRDDLVPLLHEWTTKYRTE